MELKTLNMACTILSTLPKGIRQGIDPRPNGWALFEMDHAWPCLILARRARFHVISNAHTRDKFGLYDWKFTLLLLRVQVV